MKLTVVIIGKNEEQFIAQAISSSLAAKPRLEELEVIFVDSASTDRSVEIAQEFPIRILQLRSDWPLCVAAGRYTGFLHSLGQYIMFLDGDAKLEPDWIVGAVEFMDNHPEYGAVAGVLDEEYVTPDGEHVGGAKNVFEQDLDRAVIEDKVLGGIAMYRREALERAGTVNPHLPTCEDHEVCMRIRNAGFKLARIEGLMAVKYTENRETLHEIMRRSRTKMYDFGAVIRYCAAYGAGIQFCVDAVPFVVSFAATILVLLILIPLSLYIQMAWLTPMIALLLFVAMVIKKGSLHGAVLSLATRAVTTFRTIVSFFRCKPKPVEAYPTDCIVIK